VQRDDETHGGQGRTTSREDQDEFRAKKLSAASAATPSWALPNSNGNIRDRERCREGRGISGNLAHQRTAAKIDAFLPGEIEERREAKSFLSATEE